MSYESFLNQCLHDLNSADADLRADAAYRLGDSGPRASAAVPALIARLSDIPSVASSVGYALEEIGLGEHAWSEPFLGMLLDPNPELRMRAVGSIRQIPPDAWRIVAPVLSLLSDDNEATVDEAARLLLPLPSGLTCQGASGEAIRSAWAEYELEPEARRPLVRRFGERLRSALALAASDLGDPAELDEQRRHLRDADPLLRRSAVVGLARAGQPGVRLLSTEALDSADTDVRRLGAIALGCRGIGASHRLGAALVDPSAGVRREAARSLACLGDEASDEFSRLAGLLKDGDRQVRLWSAQAIRQIRAEDVSTARALIEVLQSEPDEEVRGEAALALAELAFRYSSCALLEGLVPLLKNLKNAGDSRFEFEESSKRFVRMLHRDSVDHATRHFLRTVSADPNATLRSCAIIALSRLDEHSDMTRRIIAGALEDPDERVRAVAEEILEDAEPDF